MATGRTVRQVKHGERLRRSQTSLNPVSSPDVEIKATGDVARVVKTKTLGRFLYIQYHREKYLLLDFYK